MCSRMALELSGVCVWQHTTHIGCCDHPGKPTLLLNPATELSKCFESPLHTHSTLGSTITGRRGTDLFALLLLLLDELAGGSSNPAGRLDTVPNRGRDLLSLASLSEANTERK